jgi:hypothetical protein
VNFVVTIEEVIKGQRRKEDNCIRNNYKDMCCTVFSNSNINGAAIPRDWSNVLGE